MEKIKIEQQGRIVLPKKLRNEHNLSSGTTLSVESKDNTIVLRKFKPIESFIDELNGCVSSSKIDPLDVKKQWKM